MQTLWAPWRVEYIQKEPEKGCIFCTRIRRRQDRADHVLYRSPLALVMLNRFPYNSAHLLIAPVRHTGDLTRLSAAARAALFALLAESTRILQKRYRPEGFNLGMNLGKVAGAGVVDHLHFHLLPRWGGDTNFMPALAETKVIPEHLDRTFAKLRPDFDRLSRAGGRERKS